MLLDHGADLAYRDHADCTALHFAVLVSDRPEVVALLLARGADKQARTIHGHTPADYARRSGRPKSLALLA